MVRTKIIDKQNGWGETRASFSKRNEHKRKENAITEKHTIKGKERT